MSVIPDFRWSPAQPARPIRFWLGVAVALAPAVLYLGIIARYAINAPCGDDCVALLSFLCDWREAPSLANGRGAQAPPPAVALLDPATGVQRPVRLAGPPDGVARVPVLAPGAAAPMRLVVGLEPALRSATGNDRVVVRSGVPE